MPFIRCPNCDEVATRERWLDPGETWTFELACPTCSHRFDIADLETMLRDPRDA